MYKFIAFSCSFFALMVADKSMALVPVVDVNSILGTIRNIEAIEKMKNAAHGDMERLRGDFNALNPMHLKSDGLSKRTWSTGDWKSLLAGVGGGDVGRSIKSFKDKNKDIYEFSRDTKQKEEVNSVLQANAVLDAESTQEYDKLDSYTKKINALSNLITVSTTVKSAMDVNSKLLAELAYLQVEILRMEVIANQTNSQRMRHGLKLAADSDKFLGSIGSGQ